jgi:hypothetical protein
LVIGFLVLVVVCTGLLNEKQRRPDTPQLEQQTTNNKNPTPTPQAHRDI